MTALPMPPSRVQQVYDAIVDDICTGRLAPGTRLRQEELADRLQVSRQPVQQALLLLRSQGMLQDAGRRGLEVAAVDADFVRHLYGLRAVLDGYAARSAAGSPMPRDIAARGRSLVEAGQQAEREHAYAHMVVADVDFHRFVMEQSGNPLLLESAGVIWRNVQRVMSELLFRGGAPEWVWQDHAAIFDAIEAGDGELAEHLARQHAEHGCQVIVETLERVPAEHS